MVAYTSSLGAASSASGLRSLGRLSRPDGVRRRGRDRPPEARSRARRSSAWRSGSSRRRCAQSGAVRHVSGSIRSKTVARSRSRGKPPPRSRGGPQALAGRSSRLRSHCSCCASASGGKNRGRPSVLWAGCTRASRTRKSRASVTRRRSGTRRSGTRRSPATSRRSLLGSSNGPGRSPSRRSSTEAFRPSYASVRRDSPSAASPRGARARGPSRVSRA